MKVNPIYKKELKIGVRSIKMALIIMGFNMLLALFGLFAFYITFSPETHGSSINYGDILNIYFAIVIIESGLVFFLVPAFTAGAISGERERQTLEILLTTRVKPLQIIIGKLASSISTILLLTLSSMPVIAIVFAVGGIRFIDVFQLIIYIFVTSIFIGSMGMLYSCLFKKTVIATVFTYGTIVAVCLGTVVFIGVIYVLANLHLQNVVSTPNYIQQVDVGNSMLLLLINPAITLMSMLNNQYGGNPFLEGFLGEMGNVSPLILNYWFQFSMAVQLVISGILIVCSAKILNPIKKRAGVRNEPK